MSPEAWSKIYVMMKNKSSCRKGGSSRLIPIQILIALVIILVSLFGELINNVFIETLLIAGLSIVQIYISHIGNKKLLEDAKSYTNDAMSWEEL